MLLKQLLGLTSLLLLSCSIHAQEDIHTRTLAASCAACHGTNGNSHSKTPVLAGLDATHFVTQMQAFKNDGRASTVMHHHAKGLTAKEIELLAVFFSKKKRISPPALPSQPLRAHHD